MYHVLALRTIAFLALASSSAFAQEKTSEPTPAKTARPVEYHVCEYRVARCDCFGRRCCDEFNRARISVAIAG